MKASTEQILLARVTSSRYFPEGIMESTRSELPIAARLSMPNSKCQAWIRCMNLGQTHLTLQPEEAIGRCTATELIQAVDDQACAIPGRVLTWHLLRGRSHPI